MSQETQGAPAISAQALVHQEGLLGLIATILLLLRERGPIFYLLPQQGWPLALTGGLAAGLSLAGLLWLLRDLGPARELEQWFAGMLQGWSLADAVAVAVISGLAEEVLVRALLQPLVGLVPASLLFALLHIFPDRRLWFWPIMALALGLILGLLYEQLGYPAAAVAHVVINAIGLVRLCRSGEGEPST